MGSSGNLAASYAVHTAGESLSPNGRRSTLHRRRQVQHLAHVPVLELNVGDLPAIRAVAHVVGGLARFAEVLEGGDHVSSAGDSRGGELQPADLHVLGVIAIVE